MQRQQQRHRLVSPCGFGDEARGLDARLCCFQAAFALGEDGDEAGAPAESPAP
jgi:hypothetical protein